MSHIGRPQHQMTTRRRQVLEQYRELAQTGARISAWRIARACGIYDYRNAKRVLKDLREMGAVS